MAKPLKPKKHKVAPKKVVEEDKKIVLVGTYKSGQLEKWPGYYNYPICDGDKIELKFAKKVNEIWLFNAKKEPICLKAEFIGFKTRDELKTEYGYPATGKPHGTGNYILYSTSKTQIYNPASGLAEKVIVRLQDFATSKSVQKKLRDYLDSPDRKDPLLANCLPPLLTKLPPEVLRVCEAAVQMDFFCIYPHVLSDDQRAGKVMSVPNGVFEDTAKYLAAADITPVFFCGDALDILRQMPENSVDCCMTSPPYWNKRQYRDGGIGLESTFKSYIDHLLAICAEVYRVLKPSGSFWLNIGDSYFEKNLLNIPSRVAIQMQDSQGWILRNTVIWNKIKGCPDNSLDKLRNIYEPIFHFVKKQTGYYYDVDRVRNKPHSAKVVNGAVVSATGVSGIKYKRKIELSTVLSTEQKQNAMIELTNILDQVKRGEVSDFRMIILGEQRTTHSDSEKVSGRAKELHDKGFYFLKYNPKGSKPSDLWDIIPEDSQGRESHFAPYPEDLCVIPIKLTCPKGGVVLDPFSGTGTTMKVACSLGMKSIGIDISHSYINDAKKRIAGCFAQRELF